MITKYYEKIRGSWEANAACFVNTGWRTGSLLNVKAGPLIRKKSWKS